MHEPVESGDCIACHLPHISENEKLLSGAGNDLCFQCHKVRKEEFTRINVHEPVKKDCTICHDPHGSSTIYHLRNKKDAAGNYVPLEHPIKELCLNCHRKLDPEIVDQIENGTTRHEPVDQGKCTVCHTPHSTDHSKQLKMAVSKICFPCHEDKEKQITKAKFKHGPIRDNGCAQCHLPHGSKNRMLLRSKFTGEFSAEFSMDNYELCFNCHETTMVLKEKTNNTTGFRNGKTNLHYLHVNTQGRNCKACHNIHASNQKFHLRKKIPFTKKFIFTLKYKKTENGGRCIDGCHKPRKYDRINPIINK
jgi:predicted CXXCH cytochrome family protein